MDKEICIYDSTGPAAKNQPRIDFSYNKYVPRLICLLICVVRQGSSKLKKLCRHYLTALERTMFLLSTFAEYRFRVDETIGQVGQLPLYSFPSGLTPSSLKRAQP
jgi:hypothetical protein